MLSILLINPNTSAATTAMMEAAARTVLPPGIALRGVTARVGPAMITDAAALASAAAEVVRLGLAEAANADAVIVAAFGDPGVPALRAALPVPVIGIGEAALREAAAGGRRFGIATTTPGLRAPMEAAVRSLGFAAAFTGLRIAEGDPVALAADPPRQAAALLAAATACLDGDGAAVAVIGGGPLSAAAAQLAQRMGGRIVAPVPAAIRAATAALAG